MHLHLLSHAMSMRSVKSGTDRYLTISGQGNIKRSAQHNLGTPLALVSRIICTWNPFPLGESSMKQRNSDKKKNSHDHVIEFRDELKKLALRFPTDGNWTAYKHMKNKVNYEIKNAKMNYYNAFFKDNRRNIKNTWKGINRLIGNEPKFNKIAQLTPSKSVIYSTHIFPK